MKEMGDIQSMEFVDEILKWFDSKTVFSLTADEQAPVHEKPIISDPNLLRNGRARQPVGLTRSRPQRMISCSTCAHGTAAPFRPGNALCRSCFETLLIGITSDGDRTEKTVDRALLP
jgi:hypothetical protein